MLTKTQIKILSFLISNPEEQLTIRGIAKRLNKSYTLVYNNITNLEKKQIIKKQSVPPAQIITINKFAPKNILINIELERKNQFINKFPEIKLMLNDILSSAKNIFFILIIFGSYAKNNKTKKSDLDLLIIVQNKIYIKEMQNIIQNTYTKVKKTPNFVDVNDFKEMIQNPDKLNIGNEAKKNHIILYGTEQYYQLIK